MSIVADWTLPYTFIFCLFNSSFYVVSLYLIPKNVRMLPRDDVSHMKYRMTAAVVSTIVSMFLFTFFVPTSKYLHVNSLVALGLGIDNLLNKLARTILLMTLFYLGPLLILVHYIIISMQYKINSKGVCIPHNSAVSRVTILCDILFSDINSFIRGSNKYKVMAVRNIIIAPITEEIVYRSVLAPTLYIALQSQEDPSFISSIGSISIYWIVVYINPLWFGLAHFHHLVERVSKGGKLLPALIATLVQFTYTSIFGIIATLLLLRTDSIYTSILSHCICNLVGLPDISFMTPSGKQNSGDYSCLHSYRYVHLIVHILGLVLFIYSVLPLTEIFAMQSIYWK